MQVDWGAPVSDQEAARRAGGRRHYNSWRAHCRLVRWGRLLKLWGRPGIGWWHEHGFQTRMARALGVSRSTVCRDLAALLAASNAHSRRVGR